MNVSSDKVIEVGNFAPRRLFLRPPESICIVDWNINRGLRLNGILDFLTGVGADLILLQESDLNARRTHRLNIAREIAQKLEMNYVFGREFQELTQGSNSSPAYHGQVTLSRWPLSNPRIIRFKRQSTFWRPRWFLPDIEPLQERIGGRMALVTETTVGGSTLVSYNLHLESLETTRTMIEVAKESLAARQENARLTENQFKEGVSLTSQRDATQAQAMKAQAGLLESSLDYLLTQDELNRVLGSSAK